MRYFYFITARPVVASRTDFKEDQDVKAGIGIFKNV